MSLEHNLYILYGYRINGTKIQDRFNKAVELNQIDNEDYLYDLSNGETDELIYIYDSMGGEYEYVGIKIDSKYLDYGGEYYFGINPGKIAQYYNDEKLDLEIQSKLNFIGDLYDPIGLMDNELPKLWVVVAVS